MKGYLLLLSFMVTSSIHAQHDIVGSWDNGNLLFEEKGVGSWSVFDSKHFGYLINDSTLTILLTIPEYYELNTHTFLIRALTERILILEAVKARMRGVSYYVRDGSSEPATSVIVGKWRDVTNSDYELTLKGNGRVRIKSENGVLRGTRPIGENELNFSIENAEDTLTYQASFLDEELIIVKRGNYDGRILKRVRRDKK